ncbi:hypothetical protein A3Q56_03265 [Intoshia linei]|uniref:C2 domain-containing protein n=1 Tax=Intoshia linei TaxID=1819745 RepID=A0A177B402_9BILA|nr:hypothetical protein A3Q56_03265 [Intoshia linei]
MSNKIYRHRYYLRRLWKTNYGHIEVNDKPIPKFLLDANFNFDKSAFSYSGVFTYVKIENVNKWTSDILPKPDKWVLPNDPRFHKQELKNDINYQIEPAYIVTQNIKSSAGFPQAMNLTNTVVSDECFPEYFKNISQVPNEGMLESIVSETKNELKRKPFANTSTLKFNKTAKKKRIKLETDEEYSIRKQLELSAEKMQKKAKIYEKLKSTLPDDNVDEMFLVDFHKKHYEEHVIGKTGTFNEITTMPANNYNNISESITEKHPVRSVMSSRTNMFDELLKKCETRDERLDRKKDQWNQEYHEAKQQPNYDLDYANVRFDEVREHGVGFYEFSKDYDERKDEHAYLNDLRQKTKQSQEKTAANAITKNLAMEKRLKKIRDKRNLQVSDSKILEIIKKSDPKPVSHQANSLEREDELVKRLILYAHVFHYEREKLPRRKPLINKPIWKFKAEIGITHETIVSIMTRGLLRYILSSKPTLDVDMVQNIDTLSLYNYIKNVPIILKNKYTCGLYTTKLFEPFLEHDKVKKLSELKRIPSLFPYSHILDLKKTHIYDKQNTCQRGWKIAKLNYLSTSFMSIPTHSNLDYIKSILLYSAYSQAIQLKTLYRSNSKNESELENPACIKTIATDGEFFHICHFQLNSLNFSDNSKLKNVACYAYPVIFHSSIKLFYLLVFKAKNLPIKKNVSVYISVISTNTLKTKKCKNLIEANWNEQFILILRKNQKDVKISVIYERTYLPDIYVGHVKLNSIDVNIRGKRWVLIKSKNSRKDCGELYIEINHEKIIFERTSFKIDLEKSHQYLSTIFNPSNSPNLSRSREESVNYTPFESPLMNKMNFSRRMSRSNTYLEGIQYLKDMEKIESPQVRRNSLKISKRISTSVANFQTLVLGHESWATTDILYYVQIVDPSIFVIDGVSRLIVPSSMINTIIEYYHNSKLYCHPGLSKLSQMIKKQYNWPYMSRDLREYLNGCDRILPSSRTGISPIELVFGKQDKNFLIKVNEYIKKYTKSIKRNFDKKVTTCIEKGQSIKLIYLSAVYYNTSINIKSNTDTDTLSRRTLHI